MMTLHLPALPHTITDDAHSHCAFTAKILKLPAVMANVGGYEVVHYGVEGATVPCETVDIMSRADQDDLRGHDGSDQSRFFGDDCSITSPLYVEYNRRLRMALRKRVRSGDLVLMPFGWGHASAVDGEGFTLVESGIGYADLYPGAPHKVFESYAWMHFHQGRANRHGHNYEWVVPNYFDVDAWDYNADPEPNTVVYFGRITELKGLPVIVDIARARPDLRFIICGQGDPNPYLIEPNIEYRPPLAGRARSALLGSASAVLMPTIFTEPFGGVAVEAMLCGTPVLASSYGAFTETIEDEVTGFRCHTLGDYIAGLDRVPELDRAYIRARAARLYGFRRVASMYDRVFRQIAELKGPGWYSHSSSFYLKDTKRIQHHGT